MLHLSEFIRAVAGLGATPIYFFVSFVFSLALTHSIFLLLQAVLSRDLLQATFSGDLPNVKLLVELGAKLDATEQVASHHLSRPFFILVELT